MDYFRPHQEPARSIYDALVKEATKRKSRMPNEWIVAERTAVLKEAIRQARILSIKEPSLEAVESAERQALGHSNYAAKWAIGVAAAMR
ncbi:hypothetical protein Bsp3421_000068 (plasmid) [Burkholderia sp. FERM BP-3421]|uniref:hypothetical protein n=1 Tax=Burkholderia sp. FERM BP-3421 TaxID=1494466 RepID=UPI00235FF097|nr:hypothetical protein [Burkholderia sp. FERM BP-3421]WDD90247.1 hypothetical protein Bsp3421_000068 [Burkholderia sp. FERM BP-3421]